MLPQTKDVMTLPAKWTPNAGPVANAVGAGTALNPPPLPTVTAKPPAQ
jgi:hypothetical protein